MAIKQIHKALEALATFDGVDGDPMTLLSEPAQREVDALVKMARVIVTNNDSGGWSLAEVEQAWDLLRELAKEAP